MIRKVKQIFAMSLLLVLWLSIHETKLHAMPEVQRIVPANQLTVLVLEEHSLPFVTLRLLVDAGSWRDPAGKEGLANLTAKSLTLGTSSLTDSQINRQLDFMGAVLDTSCGRDYATVGLKVLSKDIEKGFGLFAEVTSDPSFPEQEVQRQIKKILGSIEAEEDEPGEVAEKAFRKALFEQNPYGHPVEGTEESLSALSRQDVLDFHHTLYRPNSSILTIVGDVTLEQVKDKFLPLLNRWHESAIPKDTFHTEFAAGPKTVKIDRQITQANIVIGHQGVARDNKDYYALSVMNYILGGGGLGSRLAEEIRIKKGLAYSVSSFFAPHKHPGSFQIVLQTKNSSAKQAISIVIEQMNKIKRDPVTEQELETAQKYLVGSFPLRFTTQAGLADFFSQVEYYGLGLDYVEQYPLLINAVSRNDVQRVAQTYLHPDHCVMSIVADLRKAGFD